MGSRIPIAGGVRYCRVHKSENGHRDFVVMSGNASAKKGGPASMRKCRCKLSGAEAERIRWLTAQNIKSVGGRYKTFAVDMAIFQVSMEHVGRHKKPARPKGERT